MTTNGNHGGPTSNTLTFQLRAVNNIAHDEITVPDLMLAPRECAQTMSFSTSADALSRRIQSMHSKGFELTAIAGHYGKFISAFSKVDTANNVSLIHINTSDPGISHNYRLSTSTLQHVAHNDQGWLFAYLTEKQTASQTVIKCQTLEALLAQIKSVWKRNYRITSLTFGTGYWVAVATQTFDPEEQSYFTAADTEALQEKTKKAWEEGRKIAAITYGDDKWLVVLNKDSSIESQKWVTRKTFIDLRTKVREEWLRGFQVTSLTHGADVWLAVLTRS